MDSLKQENAYENVLKFAEEHKMEERKWEDMNADCLANIFGRLDLESRLLDVPFVCKGWHRALANPLCWKSLHIPDDVYFEKRWGTISGLRYRDYPDYISGLIKFVVDRSQGCATYLDLPNNTTKSDLIHVSDACPALEVLSLPCLDFLEMDGSILAEVIVKWKNLEVYRVGNCEKMEQVIESIGTSCNSIVALNISDCFIDSKVVASAIASKIEILVNVVVDNDKLQMKNLMMIIEGCKQRIEAFYVRYCLGCDADEEDILLMLSFLSYRRL